MARAALGHNSKSGRKNQSASERGYRFQFALARMILDRLRRFRSVTAKNMQGDAITLENVERVGRDGGMDMVIEIESKSRKSALQTANRVKEVMKSIGK